MGNSCKEHGGIIDIGNLCLLFNGEFSTLNKLYPYKQCYYASVEISFFSGGGGGGGGGEEEEEFYEM